MGCAEREVSPWTQSKAHLCSYEAGAGLYDVEYLEALFDDDTEEITQTESAAYSNGFGPLAPCSTVCNSSSVKIHCRE